MSDILTCSDEDDNICWTIWKHIEVRIKSLTITKREWYKNGGILTNPTAFGLNGSNLMVGGESGHEGIIPLSTLWEQLDKNFDKLTDNLVNSLSKGNDKDLTVNLLLDGKVVTATVVKNINQQTRLNGKSPLR